MLVRGYVDEVVISCGTDVIARHRRSYEHDDFVFNPLHYLAAGAEDRRSGPGGPTCRMGSSRGVRQAAASSGVEDGQDGQEGVRAGAQAA